MLASGLQRALRISIPKKQRFRRALSAAVPQNAKLSKPPKPVVLMFTGQGSQYAGMGKDLADEWDVAREVFQDCDDALRTNLSERMFSGPDSALLPTAIAQPAIVAHGMAILEVIKSELGKDPVASTCAILGHSVGEITGFCAAEGFSISTAVKLAHQRGIFMQSAAPKDRETGMVALFPLNLTQAKALILEVSKTHPAHVLDIACVNSPKQIVLTGDKTALEVAIQYAALGDVTGVKSKATRLEVSAPFHSRYMYSANATMKTVLDAIKMKIASVPVVSGLAPHRPNRLVPDHMIADFIPLTSSTVNFVGCIEQAKNLFMTQEHKLEAPIWIEIGPKPTLATFVSQTLDNPGKVISITNANDIKQFVSDKKLISEIFPAWTKPKLINSKATGKK